MSDTAAYLSAPIDGEKLYQRRGRKALPILVRQAEARVPITYSDLATELEMPNPRNLDYVLGSIGKTIEVLEKTLGGNIPPLQCLVVNKRTGLPGDGVGPFLIKKKDFGALSVIQKKKIVDAQLSEIYSYIGWREVLSALNLPPSIPVTDQTLRKASNVRGGTGETAAHRALKDYVRLHPEIIGVKSSSIVSVNLEQGLPSGDKLDLSFKTKDAWIGVEVKSELSSLDDITRGIFQCVKYRAVMHAVEIGLGREPNIFVFLVLAQDLPTSLVALRNALDIEVVAVSPPKR